MLKQILENEIKIEIDENIKNLLINIKYYFLN